MRELNVGFNLTQHISLDRIPTLLAVRLAFAKAHAPYLRKQFQNVSGLDY